MFQLDSSEEQINTIKKELDAKREKIAEIEKVNISQFFLKPNHPLQTIEFSNWILMYEYYQITR